MGYKVIVTNDGETLREIELKEEEICCNKYKVFIGISILIFIWVYLICLIVMIIVQNLEGNL